MSLTFKLFSKYYIYVGLWLCCLSLSFSYFLLQCLCPCLLLTEDIEWVGVGCGERCHNFSRVTTSCRANVPPSVSVALMFVFYLSACASVFAVSLSQFVVFFLFSHWSESVATVSQHCAAQISIIRCLCLCCSLIYVSLSISVSVLMCVCVAISQQSRHRVSPISTQKPSGTRDLAWYRGTYCDSHKLGSLRNS